MVQYENGFLEKKKGKEMQQFVIAVFCLVFGMSVPVQADETEASHVREVLKSAYPDADFQFEEGEDGMYLISNNEKILIQPQGECPKVSPDLHQEPPLCAVFTYPYPIGTSGRYPEEGFDPGRIRNQNFLKQLYGKNRQEVQKNCVMVNFLGTKMLFNGKHGAAEALARVSDRLESILKTAPEIRKYIFPTEGTFSWRMIQGSQRLSAHSFAIAIDLNTAKGLYWLWNPQPAHVLDTRQNYPQAIIDAFEAEGFIWGGKWHAFDFMHFEYRPEMIVYRGISERKEL